MILRSHQKQAVEEIQGSVAFGSRKVVADLPTSFGKSLVLATLAQEAEGSVAIVVTFTPLIEQIASHLDELKIDYSILKAGMDDRYDPTKRIQLIMAHTLHRRLNKLDLKVDFFLKDEAHVEWFGSKRMDEIYHKLGEPTVIAVSGTPFDSRGYKLRGSDDLIRTKSIKELTEEKYLSPVKYYIPKWAEDVDYDDLTIKGNDYTEGDIDEIVLSEEYTENAMGAMKHMGIEKKKTIVFCNSIKHAEAIAANLSSKGVQAYPFHSKQPKMLSEAIVSSFRDNKPYPIASKTLMDEKTEINCRVICAVNRISIGFDVPDIELEVMMRKTAVRSLFYQQVGRGIRTSPGKTHVDLLDLANNTATFGFHDDIYEPAAYKDKKALEKENEKLAAPVMALITKQEPTLVNRTLVVEKMKELEHKAEAIPTLNLQDLIMLYDTSRDIYKILEIAYEMNRRKTGQSYTVKSIQWVAEPWYKMLEDFPEYHTRLVKTLKTMAKNKVQKGKKINALHYTVLEDGWLRDQTPYIYAKQDNFQNKEEEEKAFDEYNAYDDIDDSDIPF